MVIVPFLFSKNDFNAFRLMSIADDYFRIQI